MKALVLASDQLGLPSERTARAITAALQLGRTDLLAAGHNSREKALAAHYFAGVETIWRLVPKPTFHVSIESIALHIARLAPQYRWIIAAQDRFTLDIMARVGGLLGLAPLTQVHAILPNDQVSRMIHVGQALAKVQLKQFPALLSIRPTAFPPAAITANPTPIVDMEYNETTLPTSDHLGYHSLTHQRPDLADAKIVVAGGLGLEAAGSFQVVEELADHLGAAVGATRGAVDAGLAASELQIGQTGRIIAPKLYVGIGLSGAIQHVAGIKDSEMIAAINHDPAAPIHAIADVSLVADLFDAAPRLGHLIATRSKGIC
ncbi:MAG: electron transfer flavoprotein subunit alpha/FixB family protein [Magnetococcales bacterium]|nr:electron transfer flavoprotein subunit alpha/FixB family protein [Magnetococcales bacterium]